MRYPVNEEWLKTSNIRCSENKYRMFSHNETDKGNIAILNLLNINIIDRSYFLVLKVKIITGILLFVSCKLKIK